jgi:ABC-type nitrate/sulfonate/bicarbonate transport system permease component
LTVRFDDEAGARAAPAALGTGTIAAGGHSLLWRLLSIALFCGVWEIAGRIPINYAFPPFSETAMAFVSMIADGSLPRAYLATLQPLVIGVVASAAIGIGLGVLMGLRPGAEWLGAPVFIVLNCYKAVRNVNPSLVDMCRSFQGTRAQQIAKIVIPDASPVIFAGLRLGVAAGFIGVVLAELLITPTGIGDLITYHRAVADYPEMYAAIASIILFSALTLAVLQRVEVALFRPEMKKA